MAERSEYPGGTFCWIDLATSDREAAKSFYGDLLGWQFMDVPTDIGTTYSLALLEMKQVAAITDLPPDRQDAPPHWSSYVSVDSVDEALNKARDLGATVLLEPTDVMTAGRMAIVQDPGGAAVSLWEAKDHIGATLVNQHGTLCWNELMTSDMGAASSFYTGLFGWTTEPFGDEYTVFINGERPAGGLMAIDEQMGPVSPNWSIYLCVDDCDAIHEKAIGLGATSQMPPTDFPEVGRSCVLSDPQGGTFAAIHLLTQPD